MIYKFSSFLPKVSPGAYVHESAQVIGNVEIAEDVSIWPCAVIRGDVEKIILKKGSNVQDCCVLHPNRNKPVIVGEGVTIGHGAVVHGSTIWKNCLIGMGAVVIDSKIGDYCIIGAGCVVTPNSVVEDCSLVLGLPHKVVRKLKDDEIESLKKSEKDYIELMNIYRQENQR